MLTAATLAPSPLWPSGAAILALPWSQRDL